MNPRSFLPALFPRPPLPGKFFSRGEEEEEGEEEDREGLDLSFKGKLTSEGFEPKLVEMGLKVADNHSRRRGEALKIGENYVREMAK